ncbi:hypothetical protein VRK_35090 [Vibrio sp. MEBiC08052]|nr:hypothetical protein VRK_35090 [Vibrio sp. MEBiC08052]
MSFLLAYFIFTFIPLFVLALFRRYVLPVIFCVTQITGQH